jgi:SpoVK/Ycf46/Vps4 family AAA+-type ATPase
MALLQQDRRVMIDTDFYHRLHPDLPPVSNVRKRNQQDSQDEDFKDPPSKSFLLSEHQWMEILVSKITPVIWNKRAFDHVVLPAQDKDLILAMASSHQAKRSRASEQNLLGLGGFLLLHGPPGTGKALIAETIAETTERPLFRISLGSIGSDPVIAQEFLRTVAAMCNIWDCVVLLDGADIFLEQRRRDSVGQSVMAVAIMEALEAFTCMKIFTTDRVGTFDEEFRSRCQLAVHLERPSRAQRERIWRLFFERLALETQGGDLIEEVGYFAEWELNGRQIRNMITMATQLADAKEERISAKHIHVVFKNSQEFEIYLRAVC